ILEDETIGGPRPEGTGIGIAEDVAILLRYDIGKAVAGERGEPGLHVGPARRLQFVACRAVADGVGISVGYAVEIGRPRCAYACHAMAVPKKKPLFISGVPGKRKGAVRRPPRSSFPCAFSAAIAEELHEEHEQV